MKRLIFTALLSAAATGVFAQSASSSTATDTTNNKKSKYTFAFGAKALRDSSAKKKV